MPELTFCELEEGYSMKIASVHAFASPPLLPNNFSI